MTKRKISATKNKIKISYEIRNIKFCPDNKAENKAKKESYSLNE